MHTPTFKIPSFDAVGNPAFGCYTPATGELERELQLIIEDVRAGKSEPLPVPGLDGFFCSGRMIGNSICLTVAKLKDSVGAALPEPITICTTHIALDEDDVWDVCDDALERAREAVAEGPHPSFSFAMQDDPEVPFTTVIPEGGLVEAVQAGKVAMEQVTLCTGFSQTIIGTILQGSGFFDDGDDLIRESFMADDIAYYTLDGRDIAGLIQTGGAPLDTLIIEPGDDGYPAVYAFIADAELDVFRVDFDADVMTLDTAGTSYLMLEGEVLDILEVLRREAAEAWEDMNPVLTEIDDGFLSGSEGDAELQERLESFYTTHPHIDVPEAMRALMAGQLGLSLRYAGRGEDDPEDPEDANSGN